MPSKYQKNRKKELQERSWWQKFFNPDPKPKKTNEEINKNVKDLTKKKNP